MFRGFAPFPIPSHKFTPVWWRSAFASGYSGFGYFSSQQCMMQVTLEHGFAPDINKSLVCDVIHTKNSINPVGLQSDDKFHVLCEDNTFFDIAQLTD